MRVFLILLPLIAWSSCAVLKTEPWAKGTPPIGGSLDKQFETKRDLDHNRTANSKIRIPNLRNLGYEVSIERPQVFEPAGLDEGETPILYFLQIIGAAG
jgi:hypothetical protein